VNAIDASICCQCSTLSEWRKSVPPKAINIARVAGSNTRRQAAIATSESAVSNVRGDLFFITTSFSNYCFFGL
jgi:hypothetical protein